MVYLLFIIGFVLLIKGAGMLVDGASSIAKRLQVPDLVVGLTVVAFGTSAPEMFVNLLASFNGNTDLAIGNVVGSNILNVFWVLGLSSVIRPLPFSADSNVNILVVIFSSLLLFIFGFISNKRTLTRVKGIFFIIVYLLYTACLIWRG